MEQRTKAILEAGINDFIKTGEPVTSEHLYHFYDFGIKPAMIRWELNDLTDKGFFFQNHPSGGRFPTNRAYRFFVDGLLEEYENLGAVDLPGVESFAREFLKGEHESFIESLAKELRLLGVCYECELDELHESGLRELFSRLEIAVKNEIMTIIKDFESLKERLQEQTNWLKGEDEWLKVFIGQSPITRSDELSLIAEKLSFKNQKVLLMAIGPKRMDYRKSLRLFKAMSKVTSH